MTGMMAATLPSVAADVAWALYAAAGVAAALAALYLVVLALAALGHRRVPALEARSRVAVLVPAHNEAQLVGRCVDSLLAQTYPRALFDVVVVADNCTDDTAVRAAAAGATVLERDEPARRGKGPALRWAMDRLLAARPDLDAIAVVDADSVVDPPMLGALVARLEAGAEVVQGEYLGLNEDGSARSELRSAAFLLFHRVRFGGRAFLGLPCHLVGNGMLFSRRVLEAHPWDAFTSAEDLEYSVDLRLAGVRPEYAPEAQLRAPVSGRGQAAEVQRLRWEGGRFHVVRTRMPKLVGAMVRQRRWSLFDAAVDLAVPPLGLLATLSALGATLGVVLLATGVAPAWAVVPWVVALAGVPAFVLAGLVTGRAPRSMWRALVTAPALIASSLATRLRLVRGLQETTWQRTTRAGEDMAAAPVDDPPPAGPGDRPEVGGVPIDPIDLDQAVARAMGAVRDGAFMQLCTVNLDFLVNARRDPATRTVLLNSEVNVADGSPVVWLGQLLGAPLPGRVAGADLVPRLAEAAAASGARVFFLGGEGGTAQLAADRLVERYPGLVVAGVHEPARAGLDEMDHHGIIAQLQATRADIVFVALGHPKQDKWIDRNRDRLPVSVAIGVGCTFDLIAGERTRAPGWMQRSGLEWLFRLVHEPGRLGLRYVTDGWCLLTVFVPMTMRQRRLARRLA